LNNQEEHSTECIDTLYKFLPIAANFLQWSSVMNSCLSTEDIGYTIEQFNNIYNSIELDYTKCNLSDACNFGFSIHNNIEPEILFRYEASSCKFPCSIEGGCLVSDSEYKSDYSQYDCLGNLLSLNENIILSYFEINQIYPNPFNPITTIRYGLSQNADVQISIYDITGRLITMLINEFQTAGYHSITWDASSFSSGIYFLKMWSNNFIKTQKMVLIK